ncbi:type II toxin-antitoxin system VapC family toxin [Chthoniobacter flavus]|nr:PIN domain-containing protein [Chthoniobacter flavus]
MKKIAPPMWTCGAVLCETCFLLRRHPEAVARLHDLIGNGIICSVAEPNTLWVRALAYMQRYANVPMSFADACLVAFAEERPGAKIFTLDSDFLVYRRGNGERLELFAPFAE